MLVHRTFVAVFTTACVICLAFVCNYGAQVRTVALLLSQDIDSDPDIVYSFMKDPLRLAEVHPFP